MEFTQIGGSNEPTTVANSPRAVEVVYAMPRDRNEDVVESAVKNMAETVPAYDWNRLPLADFDLSTQLESDIIATLNNTTDDDLIDNANKLLHKELTMLANWSQRQLKNDITAMHAHESYKNIAPEVFVSARSQAWLMAELSRRNQSVQSWKEIALITDSLDGVALEATELSSDRDQYSDSINGQYIHNPITTLAISALGNSIARGYADGVAAIYFAVNTQIVRILKNELAGLEQTNCTPLVAMRGDTLLKLACIER